MCSLRGLRETIVLYLVCTAPSPPPHTLSLQTSSILPPGSPVAPRLPRRARPGTPAAELGILCGVPKG